MKIYDVALDIIQQSPSKCRQIEAKIMISTNEQKFYIQIEQNQFKEEIKNLKIMKDEFKNELFIHFFDSKQREQIICNISKNLKEIFECLSFPIHYFLKIDKFQFKIENFILISYGSQAQHQNESTIKPIVHKQEVLSPKDKLKQYIQKIYPYFTESIIENLVNEMIHLKFSNFTEAESGGYILNQQTKKMEIIESSNEENNLSDYDENFELNSIVKKRKQRNNRKQVDINNDCIANQVKMRHQKKNQLQYSASSHEKLSQNSDSDIDADFELFQNKNYNSSIQ